MITTLARRILSGCLLAASAAAQTEVWVVDITGAGDFTTIQAAVDFAGQRDTVLVRAGGYPAVLIDNKSLQLVPAPGHRVTIAGNLTIRNLPPGRPVVVRGLNVAGELLVAASSAQVLLEGLVCQPTGTQLLEFHDIASHRLVACADVVLDDCELIGRNGTYNMYAGSGEHALRATDSHASLYRTTLRGGHGGGTPGAFACIGASEGNGGDGLQLENGSLVRSLASALIAGSPGSHPCGPTYGSPGTALVADPSSQFAEHTHPVLSLAVEAVTAATDPLLVEVSGPPGAFVALIEGPSPFRRLLPLGVGTLHLANPLSVTTLGTIPGSGTLQTTLNVPPLPVGDEFRLLRLQLFGVLGGGRFLSNPSVALVLDSSLVP